MTSMDAAAIADIEARFGEAMRPKSHMMPILIAAGVVLYSVYCWWFFAIGDALQKARWDIAGSYLADWISWEARPDIEIEPDGAMRIEWPRFSPLGAEPRVAWIVTREESRVRTVEAEKSATSVEQKNANSFMVPDAQGTTVSEDSSFTAPDAAAGGEESAGERTRSVTETVITHASVTLSDDVTVEVAPPTVTVRRGDEVLSVILRPDGTVAADGPLPTWAEQKYAGEKIVARLGFTGRVEVNHDDVKIRRRFLGWENFLFDTYSPFWGKSAGEVIGLIGSGERIDPDRSNLSLAWNNILYNAEWQHLDVWTKLLQTIVMAFVGTLFAGTVAFPLAFLAARNITPNRVLNQFNKRFFDFLRSVDMLIWALFFTRAFGPGPLAGISAIFFTDTGTLGKLYSEALENIDDRQREGVRSVGAAPSEVQRFGVLPQVLPLFASQALYFWESNTRSATIIGAVGAGGIGLKLWEAMRTNQDWENVAYMVILILAVVFIFDNISNALRSRLMGTARL